MTYQLSIIIPTKNRQEYCIKAVEQILQLKMSKLQIVVQDNSDDSSLKDEISKIKYDKSSTSLVYNYYSGILSFVDNFSMALDLAEGEYVCLIGDDDGVLPNIMDETIYASKNSYDAIIPGLNIVYFWPSNDNMSIKRGSQNGLLYVTSFQNYRKVVNPQNGLIDLMNRGGQNYQDLSIPRLYHGIVKRSILVKIRDISGKYFDGLTPDIYIATALSLFVNRVYRVGYPITISGICSRSGSADSATGKHTGKLSEAPHFKGHKNYNWDKKAPDIYSVESIWAESVLHCLQVFNEIGLYNKFSVLFLDSLCLYLYPQFREEIFTHAKCFNISEFSMKCCIFKIRMLRLLKRIENKMKSVVGIRRIHRTYNLANISDAAVIASKFINTLNIKDSSH